jgi:hypothetical protein
MYIHHFSVALQFLTVVSKREYFPLISSSSEAVVLERFHAHISRNEARPPGNWSSYLLLAVIGLIAVLPIWLPTYPAMCDAPQHAAQTVLYSQFGHPDFAFNNLLYRHTRIPNLLCYVLLLLLKPLVGVVAACKLVTSAALFLFLLACGKLLQEFQSDPRLALLVIPAFYGHAFEWGFIGFLATAPLGIALVIFSLRYYRRPSLRRGVLLALWFMVVFLCHAMTAASMAALAAFCALANLSSWRQLAVRWLPLVTTAGMAGLWWLHSIKNNPLTHEANEWRLSWYRFPDLFTNITGWPVAATAAPALLALLVPVALLSGLRRQARYLLPLLFCMLLALLGPHKLFGVASLYERCALFVLPCCALALKPLNAGGRKRARLAVTWMVLFALAWTAQTAWRMQVFDRETRGFSALLPQMEPGQRVLSLNFERRSEVFDAEVFLHIPAWYSALKNGMVDPSFACGNVDLVLYRPEAVPKVHIASFEFHPESFDWQRHNAAIYRYFVVHSKQDNGEKLFAAAGGAVVLRARADDWWLYENTAPLSAVANP